MKDRVSVLFVCLGNICRSPTAQAIFGQLVEERGLADRVVIDSGGTGSWHVGQPPDERAIEAAHERGYDLSDQRARQITREDCSAHDYVIVMDTTNLETVKRLCPDANVHRLLDFAPDQKVRDVPDPYYGDGSGFDEVIDLIEEAAIGLVNEVESQLGVPAAAGLGA